MKNKENSDIKNKTLKNGFSNKQSQNTNLLNWRHIL